MLSITIFMNCRKQFLRINPLSLRHSTVIVALDWKCGLLYTKNTIIAEKIGWSKMLLNTFVAKNTCIVLRDKVVFHLDIHILHRFLKRFEEDYGNALRSLYYCPSEVPYLLVCEELRYGKLMPFHGH